jgi:hypothetical protein
MTPPKGYRLVKRGRVKKGDKVMALDGFNKWERAGGLIGWLVQSAMKRARPNYIVARKTAKRGKRK